MENPLVQAGELLDQGSRFALARIVRLVGSAPRALGAKCIIRENGDLLGTIGGGFLEHQVLERARDVLREGKSTLYHFRLTGENLAASDMLCGGIVDVYLEPLYPENPTTVAVFRKTAEVIKAGGRGTLLTLVAEGIGATDETCRALVLEDGSAVGELPVLQERHLKFAGARTPRLMESEEKRTTVFAEPVQPDAVLFIFGAGHVSTFIAPLAKMVGFRVVIIDDREEFANRERFPGVDEIHVLPFTDAFEHLQVTPASYIAIVTRGHISDRTVLKSALQADPAYIGMIGSKRKRGLIYQSLIDEGFPGERLEQVHSPIGIEIDAETPEEIAVSIVAELIKVRAAGYGAMK